MLDSVREALGDEVVYRRADHGGRVAAVDHIRARQYAEAGKFMFESHESLRDDYDVSTPWTTSWRHHARLRRAQYGWLRRLHRGARAATARAEAHGHAGL
ncbi:hypothetical protein PF002_g31948, partial [Phytophthora fragariae]